MVRLIKEAEAPRPSVRLSSSNNLPKIAAARNTDPGRLSGIVRGELDWIVMKCLEKDRKRRYETASGLARDIQRYLADEPVEACPPSAGYRLSKAARKYRTPPRVAGAFLVLLVLGVIVSAWQAIRATVAERVAENRKREADEARGQAEKRRDELAVVNENLRRASYVADMNLARVAWDENNLSRAHELLEKHRPRPGETDYRGFEWHYLRRLFHGDLLTVKAHVGSVRTVAFTPDGKRLVTSGLSRPRQKYSNPRSGDVKFWDAATGQPLRVQLSGHADNLDRAVLSPDGTHLAATRWDHTLLVWDLATVDAFDVRPEPFVKVLDAATGHEVFSCRYTEGPVVRDVAFSPDGKRLAACGNKGIRIWGVANREAQATWPSESRFIECLAFSPDGKRLAAGAPRG